MIELRNISKTFNATKNKDVIAVKNVSLTVEKGKIFGIIGYSGAGKSTLIRCINMLEQPTAGEVYIDDINLTSLSSKELRLQQKNIGMIFQQFNLLTSRTAGQNIDFVLKKNGIDKIERKKRVKQLLTLVELSDKENAYPSQLSGGQKQRVAIARALANNPKVLLCDEATSALDPRTTSSILTLLKKLNKELGITIVLITHEMGVVKEICDEIAVMENGEIIEQGEISHVFTWPKSKTTRDFIRSTVGIDKIYDMVKKKHPIFDSTKNSKTILLTYSSENADVPLISHIVKEYNIDANIICGNIEFLNGNPLGQLVLLISGDEQNITAAFEYIKSCNVQLEVISNDIN